MKSGVERNPFVPLLVCLVIAALGLAIWAWPTHRPRPTVQETIQTINPNTAPWWELTALPEIGESTARAIVAFRERQRAKENPPQVVFPNLSALDAVPGIGPKTLERIKRYVRFED